MSLHELAVAYMMTEHHTDHDLAVIAQATRAANAEDPQFQKWLEGLST